MNTIDNNIFFSWVKDELQTGKQVRIRVKGMSMFPLLRDGADLVTLTACKPEELKEKDVVLFVYKNKYIMHRLRYRQETGWIAQGDGNLNRWEFCSNQKVLARMTAVYRPDGTIIETSSRKWRLMSTLWIYMGIFKRPLLHVLHARYRHHSMKQEHSA